MKRTLAAVLWLFAAWYAGSLASALIGAPDMLGPLFGIATALVVGLDPRHSIWRDRLSTTATSVTAS